ncbi:hypothetical protein IFM12275_14440 [Nocardia sputorum]|uniref:Uncharacterized protein n=1 Tax=Nocardia sputorum TaxID=2984338 RepID=A0ABM8CYJ7_9NOCA|nr:hypothetical protein IFM12275_14440 [Nocardia sputorum]BDU00105.1 hypothetical protein IFM12276_31330 [Nocardia sputorum]
MEPATLLAGGGEHLTQRFPESECAVADGQNRGGHAAAAAVPQQIGPGFGGLAVAVGDRDEFLAAVRAHADHHQQAQLFTSAPATAAKASRMAGITANTATSVTVISPSGQARSR